MAPGKWSTSPPELVELFDAVMPGPPAVTRKMFGYPAGFVNGHMFAALHEHRFIVRLGESDRAELLAVEGAHAFEPMAGRPMREYVVVPPALLSPEAVAPWVERAFAHAAGLPPKQPKSSGTTPTTARAAGGREGRLATPPGPGGSISARRSPGRQGPSRGH